MVCTALIQENFDCSSITSSIQLEEDQSINSSPYPDHPLNLATLDKSSQEVAILLQELQPNEGYLDLPYTEAFNWSTIFSKIPHNFPATEFYIVAFRSRLALSSVNSEIFSELHAHDEQAHCEANESGGLLKYWFDVAAPDRRNLATCVWVNRDWSLKASRLPQHNRAMELIQRGVYEDWDLDRYRLNVGGGKQWSITQY
ncbi:unnamed protein product [Adineta steineri]|uniref:Uncharacterized protein n=1 Tax=Adineta steineri TaxID=433720 RepID=A0A819S5F1_9BILA|nr:unnamed protein product [Adineta steineri]